MLLTSFEYALRLTDIPSAINAVYDAIETCTIGQKVNAIDLILKKYGVTGAVQ